MLDGTVFRTRVRLPPPPLPTVADAWLADGHATRGCAVKTRAGSAAPRRLGWYVILCRAAVLGSRRLLLSRQNAVLSALLAT